MDHTQIKCEIDSNNEQSHHTTNEGFDLPLSCHEIQVKQEKMSEEQPEFQETLPSLHEVVYIKVEPLCENETTLNQTSFISTCSDCKFRTPRKLDVGNVKTNTGEKPFACEMCNFQTVRKHSLQQHIKTRIGEKPFACSKCGFRTARRGNSLKHVTSHRGKNPLTYNESFDTKETSAAKKVRLNRERQQRWRARQSQSTLERLRTEGKVRMLNLRANETIEQRSYRRAIDASRHAQRRASETPEERSNRRTIDARRHAERRKNVV